MERTLEIQKVDGNKNGRKNCMVTVDLEFKNGNFSASADLWNFIQSDILMGGQCFDSLLQAYPELKENDLFMESYDLWKKYHLNDMHAGTPAQEAAIKEWEAAGHNYDYKKACAYLESIGLYEVPIETAHFSNPNSKHENDKTYKYGHGWLKEEIPAADVERIEYLIENGLVKEKENEALDKSFEMEM